MSSVPATEIDEAKKTVIIGVGNCVRADDGVGPMVVRCLRDRLPPGVLMQVCDGDASRLIDAWTGAQRAILVDAVQTGAAPGTLHRFDMTGQSGALVFEQSALTHGFGVAEAVALGKALGRLPSELIVVGVEGQEFGFFAPPSPAVLAAVEDAVERVLAELG